MKLVKLTVWLQTEALFMTDDGHEFYQNLNEEPDDIITVKSLQELESELDDFRIEHHLDIETIQEQIEAVIKEREGHQ